MILKIFAQEVFLYLLLKNDFYFQIENAYRNSASVEDLKDILSKGRAKKGIFEGNIIDGELALGQISSSISQIQSVDQIFKKLIDEFNYKIDYLKDIRLQYAFLLQLS